MQCTRSSNLFTMTDSGLNTHTVTNAQLSTPLKSCSQTMSEDALKVVPAHDRQRYDARHSRMTEEQLDIERAHRRSRYREQQNGHFGSTVENASTTDASMTTTVALHSHVRYDIKNYAQDYSYNADMHLIIQLALIFSCPPRTQGHFT